MLSLSLSLSLSLISLSLSLHRSPSLAADMSGEKLYAVAGDGNIAEVKRLFKEWTPEECKVNVNWTDSVGVAATATAIAQQGQRS